MQQKTLHAITAMMNGLGVPPNTDPDILIRTYSVAVDGIREDVIVQVCGRFIRGEVEGFKRGRCPATDVFTQECRSWQKTVEANEFRASRKQIVQQEERRAEDYSQERRQKMIGLLAHLGKALRGNKESQRILEPHGWKPSVPPSPYVTVQAADYGISPERADELEKMMALPDAINITAEQMQFRRSAQNKIEAAKEG